MIFNSSHTLSNSELHSADNASHPFERLLDFKTFASLRRMVTHQQTKPLLKRGDFMKQITLYLPDVAALIQESDFGFVHLEVGAMRIATGNAIAVHDLVTLRKHLTLIADLFDRADAELYEAIRVSYLEALFLDEHSSSRKEARTLLSKPMENVLRQAELESAKRRENSQK